MGGEKVIWILMRLPASGSPPRGRGKDVPELEVKGLAGITPAWAGKSVSRSIERWSIEDHPRMGGEKC